MLRKLFNGSLQIFSVFFLLYSLYALFYALRILNKFHIKGKSESSTLEILLLKNELFLSLFLFLTLCSTTFKIMPLNALTDRYHKNHITSYYQKRILYTF